MNKCLYGILGEIIVTVSILILILISSLGQKCKFSSSLTVLLPVCPLYFILAKLFVFPFYDTDPQNFLLWRMAFFYRRHKVNWIWIFRHLVQAVVDLHTGSKSILTGLRKKKMLDAKDIHIQLSDSAKYGRMTW